MNTLKIPLCESNSIWSFLFFSKMLDTKNQTVVTTICVCVSMIAPICALYIFG